MHSQSFQIMVAAYAVGFCRYAAAFTPTSLRKNIISRPTIAMASKLYMSTETEAEAEASSALVNGRIPIGSLTSLDQRAIIDNLDLVLTHLTSRRASEETLDAAREIATRNQERVSLIQARDSA
eukprot:140741_1